VPKPPTGARGRRTVTPTPPPRARPGLFAGAIHKYHHRPTSPALNHPISSSVTSVRMFVTLGCSIAGLGIATYLTLAHYTTSISLVCPNSGAINCSTVTTSAESVLLGIPVVILGLLFFVAMIVLSLPALWRSRSVFVAPARLALAVTGMGFVFYLLYAELYEVGKVCLWCTGIHVLTLVIFIAVVTGWNETAESARAAIVDN